MFINEHAMHKKPNVQTKKLKGKSKYLSRKIYNFKSCLCASCALDVLHMKVVHLQLLVIDSTTITCNNYILQWRQLIVIDPTILGYNNYILQGDD